jgi:hypothetical protein
MLKAATAGVAAFRAFQASGLTGSAKALVGIAVITRAMIGTIAGRTMRFGMMDFRMVRR